MNKKKFVFISFIILFSSFCNLIAETQPLKAGAASVNITPPVGIMQGGWAARDKPSESIADELYAKALVISDGKITVAIVTMDLLKTYPDITDSVRNIIFRNTGIPRENILMTASHTHFPPVVKLNGTGPYESAYAQVLIGKLAGVVQMAYQNMQPAWIGAGMGSASDYTFNRRVTRADGSVFNSWRFPQDTTGLKFSAIDDKVGVLKVVDEQNQLVAALVNYATHPVCGMQEMYAISADYPGYLANVVQQIEGGICMFALGTAGNQVPIEREGNSRVEIGRGLGGEALKILQRMPVYSNFSIAVRSHKLHLPTKKNLFVQEKFIDLEIQVIALGDIVIVALPGEIVVELGLLLKKECGLENIFIFELSNGGNVGYILSEQDYADGGYEALNGALLPGSGEKIINNALEQINELKSVINAPKDLKPVRKSSGFGDFSQKGYDLTKEKLKK